MPRLATAIAGKQVRWHNDDMPKRSSKKAVVPILPADAPVGGTPADSATQLTTPPTIDPSPSADPTPTGKNPAAVALGRLGGKKGGPARAAKLSKRRRS